MPRPVKQSGQSNERHDGKVAHGQPRVQTFDRVRLARHTVVLVWNTVFASVCTEREKEKGIYRQIWRGGCREGKEEEDREREHPLIVECTGGGHSLTRRKFTSDRWCTKTGHESE